MGTIAFAVVTKALKTGQLINMPTLILPIRSTVVKGMYTYNDCNLKEFCKNWFCRSTCKGQVCSVMCVWYCDCHMACRHATCKANNLAKQHSAEHGSTAVYTLARKQCQVSVSPRQTHSCKGKSQMQLPAKTIHISGHRL